MQHLAAQDVRMVGAGRCVATRLSVRVVACADAPTSGDATRVTLQLRPPLVWLDAHPI
jgi:hypothetical protein